MLLDDEGLFHDERDTRGYFRFAHGGQSFYAGKAIIVGAQNSDYVSLKDEVLVKAWLDKNVIFTPPPTSAEYDELTEVKIY